MSADISSLLTFALDDIKDFSSRQTTFSKTIVLPGTANNNRIFGHIFQFGSANAYDAANSNGGYNFNAAKSANAILFQDNIQTFRGSLRLLTITVDVGRIEYEVALFGSLSLLNVTLSPNSTVGTGLLENLDFSQYNHSYDEGTIIGSWTLPIGEGIFYPLIDYGNYGTGGAGGKANWKLPTFRPALYVKEYIDKMFKAAGFTYESALFNSTRFKQLIIPHNQKVLQKLQVNLLQVQRSSGYVVIDDSFDNDADIQFQTVVQSGFTNSSMQVFTYTGATAILNLGHEFFGTYYATGTSITFSVLKNGTAITSYTLPDPNSNTPRPFSWINSFDITLNTGDTVAFYIKANSGILPHKWNVTLTTAIAAPNASIVSHAGGALVPVAYGDTVSMNDTIPKNIKQIDFLVSLVKLFNLYVYEDRYDPKKIYIQPYADDTDVAEYIPGFFSPNSSNAVDWTYKLNRSKPVSIKPMSELTSRVYNFKYATDSDYWNDLYSKRYNQNYGDRIFDTKFEFTTDSTDVQLIFAGTPLVGYEDEDKVFSTIFKRTGNAPSYIEEQTDSVIRILQAQTISGVNSWKILDVNGTTTLATNTAYGYAGHLDTPDAPAADLNFGALHEVFFSLAIGNLSNNQFNVYWSPYMAEITDKDSKLVTASFYLTPQDICNLDFSKYIYLDGVLFRLNKIIDYNASTPGDCKVELLRVINTKY